MALHSRNFGGLCLSLCHSLVLSLIKFQTEAFESSSLCYIVPSFSVLCLMLAYLYIEVDKILSSLQLFFVVVVGPFEWVSFLVIKLYPHKSLSVFFLLLFSPFI